MLVGYSGELFLRKEDMQKKNFNFKRLNRHLTLFNMQVLGQTYKRRKEDSQVCCSIKIRVLFYTQCLAVGIDALLAECIKICSIVAKNKNYKFTVKLQT